MQFWKIRNHIIVKQQNYNSLTINQENSELPYNEKNLDFNGKRNTNEVKLSPDQIKPQTAF